MPTTRCPDSALDRNFYTVFDWMVDPAGLGLKASSAELSVYAKIYSMSLPPRGSSAPSWMRTACR